MKICKGLPEVLEIYYGGVGIFTQVKDKKSAKMNTASTSYLAGPTTHFSNFLMTKDHGDALYAQRDNLPPIVAMTSRPEPL